MNILSDLTRHLIIASRNMKIEPKLTLADVGQSIALSGAKTPQILPPTPVHEAFLPSLMVQKQELKPIPLETPASLYPGPQIMQKPSFDLGTIEEFIEDNSVSTVICDGPLRPIKIKRAGRLEQTSVILSGAEIDYVINLFSRSSNLPLIPVFRANIENLSILALVSSIESRFMITINH